MKCFDRSEDLSRWYALNRGLSVTNRATSPCEDCTQSYQAKMQSEERCTNPEKVQDPL